MKKCNNEKKLALYAGGDLPGWEKWRMSRHLRRCARCREELAVWQATRSVYVRGLMHQTPATPAPDFLQRLRPRITGPTAPARRRKAAPAFWPPRLRPALYVTLAAVFAFAGVFMLRRSAFQRSDAKPVQADLAGRQAVKMSIPVVENVRMPGYTVMTFQTSDPKIKIVWFFKNG